MQGIWIWVAWPPVAAGVVALQVLRRGGLWHTLGVLLLTAYVFWVVSVAFFPMPIEKGWGFSLRRAVNLVPLRDLVHSFGELSRGQIIRQHGGNFLLLVPFTLLGPVLWPRLRSWKRALAIGAGGSAAIELLQLAADAAVGSNYRSADIDDVIVNTAGALVGYAVFVGLRRTARAWRGRARGPGLRGA